MELPDGTILMHIQAPYDPVKAHEYYIRNRKLKGLQGGAKITPKKDIAKYQTALTKFLGTLPMAVEGASLRKTADFVNRMTKMTDQEMAAEAVKIRKAHGDNDGAQVATIKALLKNRTRVRQQKAKKIALTNVSSKDTAILPPIGRPKFVRPTTTTKN